MEWIAIVLAGALVMSGVVAIVAARAAAGGERVPEDRSTIWAAGYAPRDLRLLAGLAALARAELGATTVEVVLFGLDGGIVVTGSGLAPGRLGVRVEDPEQRVDGITVPIETADGTVGAVTAAGGRLFDEPDVARLKALVGEAARRLRGSVSA